MRQAVHIKRRQTARTTVNTRPYQHHTFERRVAASTPTGTLCLALSLLLGLFLVLTGVESAAADETASTADAPLSLDECIEMTLVRSPYMKIHDLKVEIKGLDAKDAWYQMFPKINLQLMSNVPIAANENSNGSSFRATLTTGHYDPVTANISHEAQLQLTQLAKYAKLETATELIQNTTAVYLRGVFFSLRMAYFDKLIKLAKDNLAYVKKSYPNSPAVPLDVRLAEHQINKLKLQKAQSAANRANELIRLKRMLGFPAEQKLELETSDVERSLFRSFDSRQLTFDEIRSRSIKEKMARISLKLAENNILAAWAKYVPKFSFSMRTPDPVNNENKNKDDNYYFTLTMTAPLWHWGELQRGREKARLRKQQTLITTQADWLEFEDEWYTARSSVQLLQDTSGLTQSEAEIRAMNVRKTEIMFNAGQIHYNNYIQAETSLIQSKIEAANAQEAYLLAKLNAYAISGELLRRFVTIVDENKTND